ncbi:2Fe-2S iron-sulfur cluster-binding protein [Brevibacillus dissolubilis]|uniref:2Fe-2S iron-sulfur cluster-binding protein n=1 Tax=Brevibacillus dissolubilis TaxID=1844116 RepID=UPI001117AB86|nr:2Fe-2S iron-sulfur cluster-binding protein [Brevibacillus dissolubilis]
MPKIEVPGKGTFEVASGTKLVLALEDNGVDILHRCGGVAKCTTCRVEVISGYPGVVNELEQTARQAKGVTDEHIRLSCQCFVHDDLVIKPLMTVSESGMEAGPRPAEN